MARYSPEKPNTRRSRAKASLRSYLGSMRIPLSPMPRPSTRPPRRRALRNKDKATHLVPRYLHLSSLGSYSQRVGKAKMPIGPPAQRADAKIAAKPGRTVEQYAYVISLPRPHHQQDPTAPQPAVPSKRPHPISLHSNDHYESDPPQKRHRGREEDASGLSKRALPPSVLSIPLPPGGALPSISRDPELLGNVLDRARKSSCHSTLPISTQSLAENFPEKHKRVAPHQITATSTTRDLNQIGKAVGSMSLTKSLFKSVDDVIVPGERPDRQKWQECEPPRRRVVNGTKRGLFDETHRHHSLSEPKETFSNRRQLSQNFKTVTGRILRLWLFLFACLLGAFMGGMLLYAHPAPEFPKTEWELKDHESLHCSGDEIRTCSLL